MYRHNELEMVPVIVSNSLILGVIDKQGSGLSGSRKAPASGELYTEFFTKRLTVNSDRYYAALPSLKHRVHRIRKERNVFLLHHDNTIRHCSAQTQGTMRKVKLTVIPQPFYCPDLAPSAFWMLLNLKETLKGQHLSMDIDQAAMRKWTRPESFCVDGMKKKNERLNICITFCGA
ncbi:hypothetical protein TNCV_2504241 [Trichonephila clavipes]|nr:hypothetical protein TNCV_2504241 [Trichonephila clavipes]